MNHTQSNSKRAIFGMVAGCLLVGNLFGRGTSGSIFRADFVVKSEKFAAAVEKEIRGKKFQAALLQRIKDPKKVQALKFRLSFRSYAPVEGGSMSIHFHDERDFLTSEEFSRIENHIRRYAVRRLQGISEKAAFAEVFDPKNEPNDKDDEPLARPAR
jgi:hypothetical protein